jgi:hypothetical protein
MPKGKTRVDVETFVVTWQSKENIQQVATALDVTAGNARGRAARLRKLGVKLQEFPRMGGGHYDIPRLNKLASEALHRSLEQPKKGSAR